MAIIVDKVQKRKDIALSCRALFLTNNLKDITISQIAKTAGVSKGSIYDYYANKEEILFELVNILMQVHDENKELKLRSATSTKEKIRVFSDFFYDEKCEDLRELYKAFLSINLVARNEEMMEFQTGCFHKYLNWMHQIIEEGISKGELIPEAKLLAKGMFCSADGLFLAASTSHAIDNIQEDLDTFINVIFQLIEVKK